MKYNLLIWKQYRTHLKQSSHKWNFTPVQYFSVLNRRQKRWDKIEQS